MQQIAPQQDCSAARLQRSKTTVQQGCTCRLDLRQASSAARLHRSEDAHAAWAYARSALQHISRAERLQLQAVFQSELYS